MLNLIDVLGDERIEYIEAHTSTHQNSIAIFSYDIQWLDSLPMDRIPLVSFRANRDPIFYRVKYIVDGEEDLFNICKLLAK